MEFHKVQLVQQLRHRQLFHPIGLACWNFLEQHRVHLQIRTSESLRWWKMMQLVFREPLEVPSQRNCLALVRVKEISCCLMVLMIVLALLLPTPLLQAAIFSQLQLRKTLSVVQLQHLAARSVAVAGASLDYVRPSIIFAHRVRLEMALVMCNKRLAMPRQVARPQLRLQVQPVPLLQQQPPRVAAVAVGRRIRASTRTLWSHTMGRSTRSMRFAPIPNAQFLM